MGGIAQKAADGIFFFFFFFLQYLKKEKGRTDKLKVLVGTEKRSVCSVIYINTYLLKKTI